MADSTRQYNWIDVLLSPEVSACCVGLERNTRRKMEQFNVSGDAHLSSIWTRYQEKTLWLAALLAVGVNPDSPTITMVAMDWALDLVRRGPNH